MSFTSSLPFSSSKKSRHALSMQQSRSGCTHLFLRRKCQREAFPPMAQPTLPCLHSRNKKRRGGLTHFDAGACVRTENDGDDDGDVRTHSAEREEEKNNLVKMYPPPPAIFSLLLLFLHIWPPQPHTFFSRTHGRAHKSHKRGKGRKRVRARKNDSRDSSLYARPTALAKVISARE